MKNAAAASLMAIFAFSGSLCADGLPFTVKNAMKGVSPAVVEAATAKGHSIEKATPQEVDALLASSPNDVAIIATQNNCEESSIKGSTCMDNPSFKTMARYIEKNPKKNYVLMCNTGNQSLMYKAMFMLSGVELPNLVPVSWKEYREEGKFVENKTK